MIDKNEWVWMPHPGHFICAMDCRFHLNTYVGGYIVSTIGEYLPDEPVREILAKNRGVRLEGLGDARLYSYMDKIGWEEIGHGRTYETMVFEAEKRLEPTGDLCCPWQQASGDVDFVGYRTAVDAVKGHEELCAKWSRYCA